MSNWYKVSFSIAMMAGLFSSPVSQAQTNAPTLSPANPTEERTNPTPFKEPPVEQTTQRDVSCPPGQFPSAFPDVPPGHWAYEAVIQLASPPIKCFPNLSGQ